MPTIAENQGTPDLESWDVWRLNPEHVEAAELPYEEACSVAAKLNALLDKVRPLERCREHGTRYVVRPRRISYLQDRKPTDPDSFELKPEPKESTVAL
jgi:hypothetical protein